jgi:hypothetical protein
MRQINLWFKLDLSSKEYIMNEKVRLNTRFDGKISDILKKY